MSVELMLKEALGDPTAAAEAAQKAVERSNNRIMSQVARLKELVDQLQDPDLEDSDELEDEAAELAEELEIEFIYTRNDGTKRVYTPEAFWEPSGGCEWVASAQYGYDYGWNV